MKTLYSIRKREADKFSGVTPVLFSLLLIIGVGQMALCTYSAVQVVTPQIKASERSPAFEMPTNSVEIRGPSAALREKA